MYPYSVVAGGIATKGDAAEAIARDPAVARHYSELNVRLLEAKQLQRDTQTYVSFRKHGRIFWTSRKVHLAAGERILSDGFNCVRGRCGNRISTTPRTPVLADVSEEPTSAELNTPAVRSQSVDEAVPGVFDSLRVASPIPSATGLIAELARSGALPGGIVGGGAVAPAGRTAGGAGTAPGGPMVPGATGPILGVVLFPLPGAGSVPDTNPIGAPVEGSPYQPLIPTTLLAPVSLAPIPPPGGSNGVNTPPGYPGSPPYPAPPSTAPGGLPNGNTPSPPVEEKQTPPPGHDMPPVPRTEDTPPGLPPTSSTPEPGTAAMVALGALAVVSARRVRSRMCRPADLRPYPPPANARPVRYVNT